MQGPIEPIQSSSPQKKKEKLDQTGDSNPVAVYDDENVNPSQLHQSRLGRVSVQGVKSLGGHFACLCRGLNFMK